jgi:hypothetical protein
MHSSIYGRDMVLLLVLFNLSSIALPNEALAYSLQLYYILDTANIHNWSFTWVSCVCLAFQLTIMR